MTETPRPWMTHTYAVGTRIAWKGDLTGRTTPLCVGVAFATEADRLRSMTGAMRGVTQTLRFPAWDTACDWVREGL